MLIPLATLTPAALAHWETLTRYDHALGRSLHTKTVRAVDEIRRFHDTHPDAICSTSWGKDSVVVAHLARLASPDLPIVWVPTVRADGMTYEAGATYRVRDAFLAAFPGAYEERPAVARNPKRGDDDYDPDQFDRPGYRSQDVLGETCREPYISGVRAEESAMRAMSIGHRGTTTARTCRPIGRWTAVDVFAYLAVHDLPTHPAYAATVGGHYDRRWLRVHPLRSKAPARSAVYGVDMDDWEDRYFPTLTRHRPWEDL